MEKVLAARFQLIAIIFLISGTFGLIQEAYADGHLPKLDLFTLSSVIVNGILATVTITQIHIYRNEIKKRLRPWIGRDSSKDLTLEEGVIKLPIHNHGALPAQKINVRHYLSLTYAENTFTNSDDEPFDMVPNENVNLRISLSNEEYFKSKNDKIYFGWKISYSGVNKIKGIYELHGMYDHGKDDVIKIKVK